MLNEEVHPSQQKTNLGRRLNHELRANRGAQGEDSELEKDNEDRRSHKGY